MRKKIYIGVIKELVKKYDTRFNKDTYIHFLSTGYVSLQDKTREFHYGSYEKTIQYLENMIK